MLKGSVAIVTGGANGLGLAIAEKLYSLGAEVAIFDKDESALEKLTGKYLTYLVDVTDKENVQQAINELDNIKKNVTILVNNAGVIYSKPLINLMSKSERVHDYESFKKILELNLSSVFLVGSLVIDKMVSRRTKGIVINISSISAYGNAGQSAYSAAKAGINALTVTWAKELGPLGIRVNAIAPGFINTESTKKSLSDGIIEHLKKQTPLRQLGEIDNVVEAVCMVISNKFMTGNIIDVNGGLTL